MSATSARRVLLAAALQWGLALATASPEPSMHTGSGSATTTGAANLTDAQKHAAAVAKAYADRGMKPWEDDENWEIVRSFVYVWLGLGVLFTVWWASLVHHQHARTLSALSPGNTQAYFAPVNRYWGLLKKHFIFAPLFGKRHHKAFMITRTIDNGCLPSRPQTSLLVAYFVFLQIATFYGIDYTMKRSLVAAAIQRRSGLFALSHLVPMFILAARNNPLIWLTGISFDTFNLFHRWVGRFIGFEILIHATTYFIKKIQTQGWAGYKKSLKTSWFTRAGTISALTLLVIMLQTPAPIRHKFYEVFLHLHQALVAVLLWGLWTHMDGYNTRRKILIGVMCIWAAERLIRVIRIVYRNVGKPMTKAEIEVMSAIAMRVKVRLARPWTFTPGQHAYLYVPSVGWWTAHPFSVVWTDEDVEDSVSEKDVLPQSMDDITTRKHNIYFLIRRMKGFTNDLYIKAQKNGGKLNATAMVEGPYNHQTLHSYGTVVLIAAGIGITHIVPHVHDLVRGHGTGAVAARRVLLIWSVRTLEELELIRDWMTVILALPKRRDVLRIMIYAFQLDKSETADLPSSTIQVFPGIAKFGPIMDEEVKNSVGSIGVCVCGIGVVADEVRFACRKWMDRVSIDFIEESFSW